nr:MAG TPA: hypothetical protein [Caudoviricetes sp.]
MSVLTACTIAPCILLASIASCRTSASSSSSAISFASTSKVTFTPSPPLALLPVV